MECDPTLNWNGEARADLERLRQVLRGRRMFASGLLALFAALMAAAIWEGGGTYLMQNVRQAVAANWPVVEGVVTAVGAEARPAGKGSGGGKDARPGFEPRVRYTYQVDGKGFAGDRHRFFLRTFDSPAGARASVPQYQAGSPVSVYYDPEDPARSLLEPEAESGVYLILLIIVGAAIELLRLNRMFRRRFARTLEDAIAGGPEAVRARLTTMSPGSRTALRRTRPVA